MGKRGTSIGDAVRAARNAAGLSQIGLAELAGVNANHLGEIERGAAVPSFTTLEKVAHALRLKLSDLIRDTEDPTGIA
jgi:transcriptional regulator with XRE-family HTH domain